MAARHQKQAEQQRLRAAQEIQRRLQEVDERQRELENRGIAVEKALRGEGPGDGFLYVPHHLPAWGWGVGWIYSIGVTLPSNQLQRSCRGKAQAIKLLVRVLIQCLHYASFYVRRGWLDDNKVE